MLGDTIVAIASPPGAAVRGVLRLSGPSAWTIARSVCPSLPEHRGVHETTIRVLQRPVEAMLLVFRAPRSFTGEDVVELHLPGSPLLLEVVQRELLLRSAAAGHDLRPATAGEFTRRAFEHGRIDLGQAEAVLQLIQAGDRQQAAFAAEVLAGGLRQRLQDELGRLLDVHALLEAGLDFVDDETGAVEAQSWLPRLEQVEASLTELAASLPPSVRARGAVALVGPANAGKSSLTNALCGVERHIVADRAGTTRDVLEATIVAGDRSVSILDGPGDVGMDGMDAVDVEALALRQRLLATAAGLLLVVDPNDSHQRPLSASLLAISVLARPLLAVVWTKSDLPVQDRGQERQAQPQAQPQQAAAQQQVDAVVGSDVPRFVVSSHRGAGIEPLRAFLLQQSAHSPGFDIRRLQAALAEAVHHVGVAVAHARAGQLAELVAIDLQAAAASLDEWCGPSCPEDLLDRIFAGFCLGK